MGKLFSFEDDNEVGNGLIIDKLLEKGKEKASPMSLTADLLKQRDQVNKDVEEHIEEQEEDQEDSDKDDSSDDSSTDNSSDDSSDDSSEEEDGEDDSSEEEDKDDKKDDKEDSSEKDDLDAADDKDSLSSLVGSGLKGKEESSDKSEKKEEKEEPATESFTVRATLGNIFSPIKLAHEGYVGELSKYNLSMEALPTEQQPVVYVKESIIESINRLTTVANNYIDNTKSGIDTYTKSLLKLNERITVFSQLVENKKHHFTHKLVKDKDLLTAVSFKGHSDPRETSRVLLKYLNESNKAISIALNNNFNELRNAFTSKDYREEGDDLTYPKQLPGFMMVKVAIVPYSTYLKTKITDFHYYNLKALKLEDIYELPAISVTEDKDIEYIVKTLNDLVISAGISIDTLKGITEHFTSFVNDLKVLSYDVQTDKYENLTELGIDAKVQDFIKFKLAMEASFININMSMNYISSMSSVLDVCLELSE